MNSSNKDQAGQAYWNETWDIAPLPDLWAVDSNKLRFNVEHSLFSLISTLFAEHDLLHRNRSLVEVGCARSAVLPLFAKKLGLRISGIDYSPNGCEQTRIMLAREGVHGEVYCSDIFSIPEALAGKFDVVISFGLVEHFSDTIDIIRALSNLLKPGGLLFTNIPNMNGIVGLAQKILDKDIYDIHIPLTAEALREAHEMGGLNVLSCDYFLSTNFGVVNINSIRLHSAEWWMKKLALALLARASMGVWLFERLCSRLPPSRYLSPYINCVSIKS